MLDLYAYSVLMLALSSAAPNSNLQSYSECNGILLSHFTLPYHTLPTVFLAFLLAIPIIIIIIVII